MNLIQTIPGGATSEDFFAAPADQPSGCYAFLTLKPADETCPAKEFQAPDAALLAALMSLPTPGDGHFIASKNYPSPGDGSFIASKNFPSPGDGSFFAPENVASPGDGGFFAPQNVPSPGDGTFFASKNCPTPGAIICSVECCTQNKKERIKDHE